MKKPFFARFLEKQETEPQVTETEEATAPRVKTAIKAGATKKYPSDKDEVQTMKYPSDADEDIIIKGK